MLTKITPQKVHNDVFGYTVQVHDRFNVEYIEARRSTRIEVEFGASIGIYKDSLDCWASGKALTELEKEMVLSRVEEALRFMGSITEIC